MRLAALGVDRGQRLDHRREIGAAVGEQVFDAARGEQGEIGFGDGFDLDGFFRHPCSFELPERSWA